MSDEQKERRVNVEDLPQAEQELTPEESKDVKGGIANVSIEAGKTQTVSSNLVQGNRIGTD